MRPNGSAVPPTGVAGVRPDGSVVVLRIKEPSSVRYFTVPNDGSGIGSQTAEVSQFLKAGELVHSYSQPLLSPDGTTIAVPVEHKDDQYAGVAGYVLIDAASAKARARVHIPYRDVPLRLCAWRKDGIVAVQAPWFTAPRSHSEPVARAGSHAVTLIDPESGELRSLARLATEAMPMSC